MLALGWRSVVAAGAGVVRLAVVAAGTYVLRFALDAGWVLRLAPVVVAAAGGSSLRFAAVGYELRLALPADSGACVLRPSSDDNPPALL